MLRQKGSNHIGVGWEAATGYRVEEGEDSELGAERNKEKRRKRTQRWSWTTAPYTHLSAEHRVELTV